jgi:hypothetical protein
MKVPSVPFILRCIQGEKDSVVGNVAIQQLKIGM